MKERQVLLLPKTQHLILHLTILAFKRCLLAKFLSSQGLVQALQFMSLALQAVSLQSLPARRQTLLVQLSSTMSLVPHFKSAHHFNPNKVQMVLFAIFVLETQSPVAAATLKEKFCKQEEREYQIHI